MRSFNFRAEADVGSVDVDVEVTVEDIADIVTNRFTPEEQAELLEEISWDEDTSIEACVELLAREALASPYYKEKISELLKLHGLK